MFQVSYCFGFNLPGAPLQRHSLYLGLVVVGLRVRFVEGILQLVLGFVEFNCVVPGALIGLEDGLLVVLLGLGDRLLVQALYE